MIQEDEDRSYRFLRMEDATWKKYAVHAIAANRSRGDLRPLLNWLDAMEDRRAAYQAEAKPSSVRIVKAMDSAALMFRLWKDMVLEPAKYGVEDWAEWMEMDQQLRCGPGRWRVGAFWAELDDEEAARVREFFATRIQAAWRGHHVRDTTPGLNCEECLARTFSPQGWNGKNVCAECLDHAFEHFANFVQPVVPPLHVSRGPREEPNENGDVECEGCGSVCVHEGDWGQYRPGWWCSRACAYE